MFFTKKTVYADAAAAAPLHPEAKKRLVELLDMYANPGALHLLGVAAKEALESARKEAADALCAHEDEIVFTSSGTEGNTLAIKGVLDAYVGKEVHAMTLSLEHPSVLETFRAYTDRGIAVSYLAADEEGVASLDDVEENINEKTVLVSVALVNSEIGVLQDVRGIAKIIRAKRKARTESGNSLPILFHIDACQAPLWLKLSVDGLHPDLMTLDGQKCGGPKGVGLLYVRRGVSLVAQVVGGGQESGRRSGTENVPSTASFARALSIAQRECEENARRVASLRDALWERIQKELPEAILNGSREHRVANNLNISIPGLLGEMAVVALSAQGVSASTRSACGSGDEESSYVLRALGADDARAQSALRFTLLPGVSKADIERILETLIEVFRRYKVAN